MSRPTKRASTAELTVWRSNGEDEFGKQSWDAPVLLMGNIDIASKHKYSSKGIEVVPNSVYWMETSASDPKKGDQIAKGDFISESDPVKIKSAEIITDIKITDCSFLRGGQIDDIMIMT